MRRSLVVLAWMAFVTASGLTGCKNDTTEVSGDATLTELSLSPGTLTPTFDPATLTYTATVAGTDNATTVTTRATEDTAVITVNGFALSRANPTDPWEISIGLAEGINVLKVKVTTSGGAVKVYTITVTRPSTANFVQTEFVKALKAGAGDQFGTSVAMDGDTLVVGAPLEDSSETGTTGTGDSNAAADSGAAYVFRWNGVAWTQEAYLKAWNTGAGDRFGQSVAIRGNTIVVGAPGEDSSETGTTGLGTNNSAKDSGAAYVFTRSGVVWTQEAYLKASNTDAGDWFGWSVTISGDTVAVGAPLEDSAARTIQGDDSDNTASHAGAVYVFTRSGASWSQESYVKADNADPGDVFGVSVALSGDTLAVGASGESSGATGINDTNRLTNNLAPVSGAVYVFTRTAGVWTQEAYLKASNTNVSDTFGWTIALDTDTLAVSAPLEDSAAGGVNGSGADADNSAASSGAVYVFKRTSGVWQQEAYVKASNTASLDSFGWGLALSGDYLAVGAPGEDSAGPGENNAVPVTNEANQNDNSVEIAGAVYVFQRSGATWSQLDYLKAPIVGVRDGLGGSMALGTLPGGTLSVVSGAIGEDSDPAKPSSDNSMVDSGAVYVYLHN